MKKRKKKAYLSDQDENDKNETEPRTVDAKDSAERQFLESVAVICPSLTESDMCETDAAPRKQCSETRQSEKPVKDNSTSSSFAHVGNGAKHDNGNGGDERTARTINVCETFGCVALFGESGQSTRASINSRETDGDDGEENDDVDESAKGGDSCVFGDDYEGRGGNINQTGAEKSVVVVFHEKTDEEETEDVEEGDTPKDLLDGAGESLLGVCRLCCCETDQFSTGKGESGRHENGAHASESICKGTRVVPGASSPVFAEFAIAGTATAGEDDTHDHENDDGGELQQRHPEFLFRITQHTEDGDDDDGYPENRNPD